MVNNVVLIGRLTRELEVRTATTGREVCNFTVAVNRNFKNAQGEYDADFVSCVAFGQTAKFMGQYLQKGNLISVTGRIQTRNYDNDQGQRVYVTEVVVDNVSGLESRRSEQNNGMYSAPTPAATTPPTGGPGSFMDKPKPNPAPTAEFSISDDDLPF